MSAKRRPTHPKQIAALSRRTSPPGSPDDGDGRYGWLGDVPSKVRRRRAQSGTSPSSSVPPISEPAPDSMPPSAPRRRQDVVEAVAEPVIDYASDDAFDRRPTLKIKAVTQQELDEVAFDEELVIASTAEEPSVSDDEQAPDSEPWPDLSLVLPGSQGAAPRPPQDEEQLAPDEPLDDSSSIDRLLGIAHSIDEVLDSSPPPAHEKPIRVSLPLFAAVNLIPDDDSAD